MPGFETRAIWGSDPGLISDRFRYTGVSVSPLNEKLIDNFHHNFQARLSLLQNVGESAKTKDIAKFAWDQAVKEQQPQSVPFNLSEAFSFPSPIQINTSEAERIKGILAGYQPTVETPPNAPIGRFQNLLNAARGVTNRALSATKETGSEIADALFPGRHNVPEKYLETIGSPEFSEALKHRQLLGQYVNQFAPEGSLSFPGLTDKESRWLLDPRRTPVVGSGAYGSVVVPTGTETAFKYQWGQPSAFYENEANMAARTAGLGYGPEVKALSLPAGGSSSIIEAERIPHRPFDLLSPKEQDYLNLETHKLTEGLFRGGIRNVDTHHGNVVLNDATGKAVQLDSGLAATYDPKDKYHLMQRLSNIEAGLKAAGLKDISKDTFQLGNELLSNIVTNPSEEGYGDMQSFLNRSGDLLLQQTKEKPAPFRAPPPRGAGLRAGVGIGLTDLIPSTEAVNRFANQGPQAGLMQMGKEFAEGLPIAVGIGGAVASAPALATPVAVLGTTAALTRGGQAINQVYRNATGRDWVDRNRVQSRPAYAGPTPQVVPRMGTAILNGKPVQVPYGSVAGQRQVGRPWWDLLGSKVQSFADVLNRGSIVGR